MSNGYKHTRLTPDSQKEFNAFKGELMDIQRQIDYETREIIRIRKLIKTEEEITKKEDSQKKQKLLNLEKEIQRLDGEIKKVSGRYSPQTRQLEREKGSAESKIKPVENLMRQKSELQIKIKELENKVKELDIEIKRASSKAPVSKFPKAMQDGQANIATVVDNLSRKKLEAAEGKEKLEKDLRNPSSSLRLQQLENELDDHNKTKQRLEGRRLDAERNLDSIRRRLKSLPPPVI